METGGETQRLDQVGGGGSYPVEVNLGDTTNTAAQVNDVLETLTPVQVALKALKENTSNAVGVDFAKVEAALIADSEAIVLIVELVEKGYKPLVVNTANDGFAIATAVEDGQAEVDKEGFLELCRESNIEPILPGMVEPLAKAQKADLSNDAVWVRDAQGNVTVAYFTSAGEVEGFHNAAPPLKLAFDTEGKIEAAKVSFGFDVRWAE